MLGQPLAELDQRQIHLGAYPGTNARLHLSHTRPTIPAYWLSRPLAVLLVAMLDVIHPPETDLQSPCDRRRTFAALKPAQHTVP